MYSGTQGEHRVQSLGDAPQGDRQCQPRIAGACGHGDGLGFVVFQRPEVPGGRAK